MRKPIVVFVEPAAQTEAPIEHEGAEKRAGAISGVLQSCGERRDVVVQTEAGVVPNPVAAREQPGED